MIAKNNQRSHKVILKFHNHLFLRYIFCLTLTPLETFQECQHYEDAFFFIKSSMNSYKVKFILAHSFMNRFWWKFIWMLISWRPEMSLLCFGEVFFIFYFKTFFSNYNLGLLLMDNFCPCFIIFVVARS